MQCNATQGNAMERNHPHPQQQTSKHVGRLPNQPISRAFYLCSDHCGARIAHLMKRTMIVARVLIACLLLRIE
eukprot:10088283-Lingulodinium_polyedra.AAC.1